MPGVKGKSGGRRSGTGPKPKAAALVPSPGAPLAIELDSGFAKRVLARVHEGAPKRIQGAEDLALSMLFSKNEQIASHAFWMLTAYIYGKPAQAVIKADTREIAQRIPRGNYRPLAGQPVRSGQPN